MGSSPPRGHQGRTGAERLLLPTARRFQPLASDNTLGVLWHRLSPYLKLYQRWPPPITMIGAVHLRINQAQKVPGGIAEYLLACLDTT